ncbi:cytochrome c oxidase accessory protein CcoG [Shewanella waksmanii]|uniref:cytochrome c oxidase accessory protein CcoG n=1 Tax=Shewanella waksmanii TaxID=213783 RepID=UPI00373706FD
MNNSAFNPNNNKVKYHLDAKQTSSVAISSSEKVSHKYQQQAIKVKNIDTPKKIHIKSQKGRYQRLRSIFNSFLIVLFFAIPFIQYQGQQAILFDLELQQFRFFGTTLWPQDFTLLAWVFIAAAFLLFFITVFWGRIWCGYLCPQTAWSFIYIWIEEKIEGSSNKRHALDKAKWHPQKLLKRGSKHLSWALVALITGCGFIAYFVPANQLYYDVFSFNTSFWVGAWVWFFAACTYLNAGWMREQMCLHCCPYARFQSAMYDANTLAVTYDATRGESRGPRKRNQATELGDCVDCHLCVDVCPTGIDIRNGLQYECINCGACADACDETMGKFGYQTGLIRYSSENAMAGLTVNRFKSLKFVGYGLAFVAVLAIFAVDLQQKSAIELNILRDRQALYRENNEAQIENSYTLKIRNKTQQDRNYELATTANQTYVINSETELFIKAGEQLTYPITIVQAAPVDTQGFSKLTLIVQDISDYSQLVAQDTNFYRP